jgi:hypothetical protein
VAFRPIIPDMLIRKKLREGKKTERNSCEDVCKTGLMQVEEGAPGFLSKTVNLEVRMKDLPTGDIGNMIVLVDLKKFVSKTMTRYILLLLSIKFVVHGYSCTRKLIHQTVSITLFCPGIHFYHHFIQESDHISAGISNFQDRIKDQTRN